MASKLRTVSAMMVIGIISKCLGFVRDMILAYFFGAGAVTDAYNVALTIPEFLFSLVIQAIAIGYIPIFMDLLMGDGKERADEFTNNLQTLGLLLVGVLVAVIYLFAEVLVNLFASGFDGETAALAGMFIRVSVWGMFFRVISAVDQDYLNANKQFIVPTMMGIPTDVITIAAIVIAYYTGQPVFLAVGIALSYAGQMLLQRPFVHRLRKGVRLNSLNLRDPNLKKMVSLFLPVSLGVGANQINILVDRTLASSVVGGISALNYANKVNNIIENLVIGSLATVMFPSFSKHAAEGDDESLGRDVISALLATTAVMLPCAIAFFAYAEDVITLLFGRGMFDAGAVDATYRAMRCYSLGLVFLSLNAVLVRALYSVKKVKAASLCSCGSVGCNIFFALLLSGPFGTSGLALASSIANSFQTVLLLIVLERFIKTVHLRAAWREFAKIILCSTAFCFISLLSHRLFVGVVSSLLASVISGLLASSIYILLALVMRIDVVVRLLDSARSFFGSRFTARK